MMMTVTRYACLWLLAACAGLALAAPPYVAYVYPAGGQQRTTLRILLGGQNIRGIHTVLVSGAGVSAKLVDYEPAWGPLNYQQQQYLRQRIDELIREKNQQSLKKNQPPKTATPPAKSETPAKAETTTKTETPAKAGTPDPNKVPEVKLPDLPDLRNLEEKTVRELWQLLNKYLNKKTRRKAPMAELATLEVTIAADAAPGDREIRLAGAMGLTNPLVFQVGRFAELREKDADDEASTAPPPATAPMALNGQILPGEVDRFPLTLRAGQQLVIDADARRLVPYMADAVPGWCQAVLALYDPDGKEIAYADDFAGDPDPVLVCRAPRDGEYTLAIRDAIYRGREDFVYRITVREGDPAGVKPVVQPLQRVAPEGVPADFSPLLPWVDSRIPQRAEAEPNDTGKTSAKVTLPQCVSGSIAQPGDIDLVQFTGKKDETIIAEVYARRLGSPMDPLLRLKDAGGKVIAWNDDLPQGDMGLITHHADPWLSAKLPADGVYYLEVSDTQRAGGEAYRYWLRVGPPQGDFSLRTGVSGIAMLAGWETGLTVYAFRKDGWDGDIAITLKDAPQGFTIANAVIPAGKTEAKITLKAQAGPGKTTLHALVLEGRAVVDGTTLVRPVVPADRVMQAFASYHLVPAQQFQVMVMRRGVGK